ncbi:9898_t:CDS:1 [Funneliformis geosporum]|uniref:9898_t:CDS:1 n=1 Tax=Funneliformis geosporum TaxID=1117311 RepID=A0A9W4SEZ7_9GLOM|nr:9898_t:CDS:1 [Funneliformis geosporum]
MPCHLITDCLYEVFEYLEEDKATLYSCLLVNTVWCKISVRTLWRNIWSYKYTFFVLKQYDLELSILKTLVSCLPDESKDFLHDNGIFIPSPDRNSPMFNYVEFCQVLSIHEVDMIIYTVSINQNSPITGSSYNEYLITLELFKMFMNKIPSLKELIYTPSQHKMVFDVSKVIFTYFTGATNCLKDLRVFRCNSYVCSEFFYQLSRICHNVQFLDIELGSEISNGLIDFVSVQQNLKYLKLKNYTMDSDWSALIPSLLKHTRTLTKFNLCGEGYLPMSFIASFETLKELVFRCSSDGGKVDSIGDFKVLQYVTFPQLTILKFFYGHPHKVFLMKFLENNGKNLEEFSVIEEDDSLKFIIAKYCPNLKKLFIIFEKDGLKGLKLIFESCQKLESMKFWCSDRYHFLDKDEILEIIVKYSPMNFHELQFYGIKYLNLLPEDLESFFISWQNRVPQKLLSIIILVDCNDKDICLEIEEENLEVIKRYMKMNVVRKLCIKDFDDEEE